MVDQNCDQVRRKIRSFLETDEMKVTEFQEKIGANSKSYGSFMGQNGKFKGIRAMFTSTRLLSSKRESKSHKCVTPAAISLLTNM